VTGPKINGLIYELVTDNTTINHLSKLPMHALCELKAGLSLSGHMTNGKEQKINASQTDQSMAPVSWCLNLTSEPKMPQ
jgi:hypothetical protein